MNTLSSPAALAISVCAVLYGCAGARPAEETVEMVSGSYRTVADGRAEILIGDVGTVANADQERRVEAVEVEVTCGEARETVWVSEERPTEQVCRIELQLVEITSWSPPKARIKIVWEDD